MDLPYAVTAGVCHSFQNTPCISAHSREQGPCGEHGSKHPGETFADRLRAYQTRLHKIIIKE